MPVQNHLHRFFLELSTVSPACTPTLTTPLPCHGTLLSLPSNISSWSVHKTGSTSLVHALQRVFRVRTNNRDTFLLAKPGKVKEPINRATIYEDVG